MRDDDRTPRELERVIDELREMPEVRPEWLASIADRAAAVRIESGSRPTTSRRRLSLEPMMAIAAGLLCAALGAGGAYVTLARRGHAANRDASSAPTVAASATNATSAPVRFAVVAPGAVSVHLVGDFNAWNPAALPMRRLGDGSTWEVEVGLSPGRYTYAFVVDGRLARDPSAAQAADDDFGVPSSVLLVKGGGS